MRQHGGNIEAVNLQNKQVKVLSTLGFMSKLNDLTSPKGLSEPFLTDVRMTGFDFFARPDNAGMRGVRSLLVAVAVTALAALLQLVLKPVVYPFPLLFYLPAVAFVGFYGGAAAGALATLMSALCIFRFAWPGPHAHITAMIVPPFVAYAIVATSVVFVMRALGDALDRAEEMAMVQLSVEKERIRALQHRMTSNMQAVASLLTLQKMKLRSDPESAARALDDARQRVVDMSRISRRLSERHASAGGIQQYLQLLCADIQSRSPHEIVCTTSEDIDIQDPDKLMALSVILTEAIGNAIRHAFEDHQVGTVTVNLRRTSPTSCQLIIKDNGRGLAPHINPPVSGSGGFLIMQAMAVQLGGKLETSPSVLGTTLILRFEL
jgi:two-component sensor histidine kinase